MGNSFHDFESYGPQSDHKSKLIMDLPKNVSMVSSSTEYFLTGVTHTLLKTYSREVTVVASTVSVIALMILGSCIWCVAKLFKSKKSGISSPDDSDSSQSGTENLFEGWKSAATSEKTSSGAKNKMENSNGKRKLMIHKNIITPDRKIEFVVPTIQLPAQPAISERPLAPEPEPSCSKTLTQQKAGSRQYYPQPQLTEGKEQSPQIGFSLYYEAATQILYVRLLGGHNFPNNYRHYVTVKLYPGRGGKQRTREFEEVMPIYNQEFSFHIRKSTLNTRILRIKAVISGNPKRVIGSINLALKDLAGFEIEDAQEDLSSTQLWKRLDQPSDSSEGVKLQVSLKWEEEPQPGLLTLKVIEAIGLHEIREANENDYTTTHVRVSLQEQGRCIKSRKTRLVRWGSVPVFDDTFVVTIPHDLLSQISFLVEIIARGRLGSKVALGKISIGSVPYANPSTGGTDFWEDMCHQPNTEITRWLQLLP